MKQTMTIWYSFDPSQGCYMYFSQDILPNLCQMIAFQVATLKSDLCLYGGIGQSKFPVRPSLFHFQASEGGTKTEDSETGLPPFT